MSNPMPEGASRITPYLTVRDASAAVDFYEKAFGFEVAEMVRKKDGSPLHVGMSLGGQSVVMFCSEGPPSDMLAPVTSGQRPPINLYVYCDDVDATAARARKAGAKMESEPEDMFWGDRVVRIADPDGYHWTFATNVAPFDPANVPDFD